MSENSERTLNLLIICVHNFLIHFLPLNIHLRVSFRETEANDLMHLIWSWIINTQKELFSLYKKDNRRSWCLSNSCFVRFGCRNLISSSQLDIISVNSDKEQLLTVIELVESVSEFRRVVSELWDTRRLRHWVWRYPNLIKSIKVNLRFGSGLILFFKLYL